MSTPFSETTLTEARRLVERFSGRAGYFIHDLRTGESAGLNAGESFPTASMIKLPILVEMFYQTGDGRFGLDETRIVRAPDHVGGSGILRNLSPGLQLPLRDLAYLMMSISDNTATNLLIDLVGREAVNARMVELGCPHLVLRHKIDFTHAWADADHLAVGTPEDFVRLMELVWRKSILTESFCEEMLRMMAGVGAERAGRWLPINPYAAEMVSHGYPSEKTVHFAGKTGSLLGVRGQVAAVWGDDLAYIVSIMTDGSRDLSWGVDSEGSLFAAQLGQLLYESLTK